MQQRPRVDDDPKATARKAISHLAYHGLTVRWEIPGELSEAARALVEYILRTARSAKRWGTSRPSTS